MGRVLSDHGPEALEAKLATTKKEGRGLYQSIMDGAAAKVMSTELVEFLQKLAENE